MLRSITKISQCLFSKNVICQSVKNMSSKVVLRSSVNLCFNQKSFYATNGETKLASVLLDEINHEKKNVIKSQVPKGFGIKESKGSIFTLHRKDSDGVTIEIKVDLAGSVGFEELEENKGDTLKSFPDFTISLIKPSSRTITFHCTLGNDDDGEYEDGDTPYRVESIEIDNVPNYYALSDILDSNVSQGVMDMLADRGIDMDFQKDFQAFCTDEEHRLYLKFLEGLKEFCI